LKFVKMSGAGNDFMIVDRTAPSAEPGLSSTVIAALCRRGLSVGADGFIEILPDPDASFAMRYYNSDGGEADMCGNGGRCAAVFAASAGYAPGSERFSFRSGAGLHYAQVTGPSSARIWMTEPVPGFLAEELLTPDGLSVSVSFADTGVPHAVLYPPDSTDHDFTSVAPALRAHPKFGSSGANVDFVFPADRTSITLRTWERGVEGETLACGTGAVAAVLCGCRLDMLDLPVDVHVKSGLTLKVGKDPAGWWLEGEARMVYCAELLDRSPESLTVDP